MKPSDFKEFVRFAVKVIVVHTVTYFIFGIIMSNVFHYERLFQLDVIQDYMRPIDSPYVFAGPFLQPIRGLLFAIGLWPIRSVILEKKNGWLILWNLLVMIGILSTPAAAPCSVEGVLYSKLPLWYHLIGLPEILLQTLLFSLALVWWDKRQVPNVEGTQQGQSSPLLAELLKAVVTGCFAYIGYAIGGILLATIAGADVDMEAAAGDLRMQMMFVVALVVNVVCVFFVARRWLAGKISLWAIFGLFWLIDTAVPLLYQTVFLSPPPLHTALLLGFFPALIIAVSMRLNYRRPATADGEIAKRD